MNGRTPTTHEVERVYSLYARAQFKRWLAEHDREVAERAWDEGHRARGWFNPDTRRTELVWSDSPYRKES